MFNNLTQSLERLYGSKKFPWIIICIGILLRLVRYLHNPSLYFDEAGIATDYADRSISDLFTLSPDSISTYPFSFQILIKLAIQLIGNTEYALRLHALIFGIASLFLFYYAAKKYISPKVVPAALLLFASLNSLVYYSSIVKPYSGDVFFALLIVSVVAYARSKDFDYPRLFLFALTGMAVIWFSNPSIFVLAGAGTSLIIFSLLRKEWAKAAGLATVCLAWVSSFIFYYMVFLNNIMSNIGNDVDEIIKKEAAFSPFPPHSFGDIKWYIDTFFDTFNLVDYADFNQGLVLTGIAALLFLIGCIHLYSKNREKFFVLVSPVFFTLAAAAMHLYPFKGRLILFLIPFFLLIIAEGIAYLNKRVENSKTIVTIIVIFLFIYPLSWAAYNIKKPASREEIKPVLQHIQENWKDGDIIYVHFYAQYAFEYYSQYHPEPFSFAGNSYITGIAPRGWYRIWRRNQVSKYYAPDQPIKQSANEILNTFIRDLEHLNGHNRAWILFTGGISSTKGVRDKEFFLFQLDSMGKQLDSVEDVSSSAYLYEISGSM